VSDPNIVNGLVDLGECQCLRSLSAHIGLRPTTPQPHGHVSRLRCRGLRLWHDGSTHRGVGGDTSRAVLLPSHRVMLCEVSSEGPPHVSHIRRTFRINGAGLAGCESEAACLECGGTVGRGSRRTRAGRFATWPHLGRNLDTGRGPAKPNIGTARACGPCGTIVLCGDSAFGTKKSISACVAEGADSLYLVATLEGVTAVESASGGWWSFWSRPRP
jgi:hypothetical protein